MKFLSFVQISDFRVFALESETSYVSFSGVRLGISTLRNVCYQNIENLFLNLTAPQVTTKRPTFGRSELVGPGIFARKDFKSLERGLFRVI